MVLEVIRVVVQLIEIPHVVEQIWNRYINYIFILKVHELIISILVHIMSDHHSSASFSLNIFVIVVHWSQNDSLLFIDVMQFWANKLGMVLAYIFSWTKFASGIIIKADLPFVFVNHTQVIVIIQVTFSQNIDKLIFLNAHGVTISISNYIVVDLEEFIHEICYLKRLFWRRNIDGLNCQSIKLWPWLPILKVDPSWTNYDYFVNWIQASFDEILWRIVNFSLECHRYVEQSLWLKSPEERQIFEDNLIGFLIILML